MTRRPPAGVGEKVAGLPTHRALERMNLAPEAQVRMQAMCIGMGRDPERLSRASGSLLVVRVPMFLAWPEDEPERKLTAVVRSTVHPTWPITFTWWLDVRACIVVDNPVT